MQQREITSETTIAFVNGEGEPIKYGDFVEIETLENSLFGVEKSFAYVGYGRGRASGKVFFIDFLRAFECHKLRGMMEESVDLSKVKKLEVVPVEMLLPVMDWIRVLNNEMTEDEYWEIYPDDA